MERARGTPSPANSGADSHPCTAPARAQFSGPSLLNPLYDQDSCGTGFVAQVSGEPSHRLLKAALTALARLAHRGAVAADGKSSDGVGILAGIPRQLLLEQCSISLAANATLAVGVFFFPQADAAGTFAEQSAFAAALHTQGLRIAAWRDVPINRHVLGEEAAQSMPRIRQALIVCDAQPALPAGPMETRLYLSRQAYLRGGGKAYVCSLSATKIVYKALCAGRVLPEFYPDLADKRFVTNFALFHQRYATNVRPSWERAQPLRMLAHNGEINTIWGNRARMAARRSSLPDVCAPVLTEGGSDSTSLDEVAEMLTRNGRSVAESLRMLVPPGSAADSDFVRYHTDCVEPWDGPAALAFADGNLVGALLDRNGLRPCRYTVTTDGFVIAGSEAGLVDVDPSMVAEHGRLGPGEMLVVDLAQRRLLRNHELDHLFDSGGDYGHLLEDQPFVAAVEAEASSAPLTELQAGYGWSREDLNLLVTPMAKDGKEAVWSMGDDTPVAALARAPQPVTNFFRQRFAQVTNPPIDSLREACVFQMRTRLGPWPHLLYKTLALPGITLELPVLTRAQVASLRQGKFPHAADLPVGVVTCGMQAEESLPRALRRMADEAVALVAGGARILLLSDRMTQGEHCPVPMAMAVGVVNHALVAAGTRASMGIAVEAGDCWDVHQAAVLIGLGAGAVCPWLALESAQQINPERGEENYIQAVGAGLAKVMSKAGISAIDSYRSAHLFDVLGLSREVTDLCFPQAAGLLSGVGFEHIESQIRRQWQSRSSAHDLADLGLVRFRKSDSSELHAWQPVTVRALQSVTGSARKQAETPQNGAAWAAYRDLVEQQPASYLRDLLAVQPAAPPLELDQIEPEQSIVRRFVASAMSLGSLSPEAHQAITDGMNLLGARSNTGEGGEDPHLYGEGADAMRRDSKIKQIASGRFGVTAEYLARAEEIEIKIAQGAKPGEGGQLPGHKVTELIARLRHSQPGIMLISPPPHHDIYSIEDLAQLIFDLKRVNPRAAVGVKLVSTLGVGTVAAGVVKAYADYVVIAGHAGGTGASPLSSIKHAGNPWELGLADAQQVLLNQGLRNRVRLRVDGGLRSAKDVLVAAMLGADEFGFGTSVLVALGCDMARACHLNTCPTGIATQNPELRAKFRGKPEHVAQWFMALAADVRGELAKLGLPSLEAAIGRTDLLQQVRDDAGLDIHAMLAAAQHPGGRNEWQRNDRPVDPAAEHGPLDDAWLLPARAAAQAGEALTIHAAVTNADRTLGARLAGELALDPLQQRPNLKFVCAGTAGQSFGAFAVRGMTLQLTGLANDYVGKGLSGGELILRHSGPIASEGHRHALLGNVALYGATSGSLYAAGRAGERFAVRNSGATAVVEGLGDHGCEYMTGGLVVVLGSVGINFGAGMTGGEAFLFDEDGLFRGERRYNDASVDVLSMQPADGDAQATLLHAVRAHVEATGSRRAAVLLQNWQQAVAQFVRVLPKPDAASKVTATPNHEPEPATLEARGLEAPGLEAARA
jgi:glutamate synthase (NADPH/NADH) large chain